MHGRFEGHEQAAHCCHTKGGGIGGCYGIHEGEVNDQVTLNMSDVDSIVQDDLNYIVNTGSPHYVSFVSSVKNVDVFHQGKAIRYSDVFNEKGINVNFIEEKSLNVLFTVRSHP